MGNLFFSDPLTSERLGLCRAFGRALSATFGKRRCNSSETTRVNASCRPTYKNNFFQRATIAKLFFITRKSTRKRAVSEVSVALCGSSACVCTRVCTKLRRLSSLNLLSRRTASLYVINSTQQGIAMRLARPILPVSYTN